MSFLAMPNFTQSMQQYQDGLTVIERQLLLREVAMRGEKSVLNKIDKKSKKKHQERYSKERDLYYTQMPTLLKTKAIFFVSQQNTDPLTHLIFERITEIEKVSGYCPEMKI